MHLPAAVRRAAVHVDELVVLCHSLRQHLGITGVDPIDELQGDVVRLDVAHRSPIPGNAITPD